jgi:RNA polymerase sigma factor for flagellar operon FliA
MKNPYIKQTKPDKTTVVLEYAPMVKHIANRLAARLPTSFQKEDLIQAGMMGLLEAVDRYDPQKMTLFKTYAELRVRGAMLDDLRKKDWIPRSVRDNCNKLEKAYVALRGRNIDYPSDQELAGELGIELRELPIFLEKTRQIPMLSLDNFGNTGKDDEQLDIMETISDPDQKDPITQLLGEEAQEHLVQALKRLPEKERLVLSLYYNEELNLKEIGAVLNVSESRVSQLRTKSIAMLRSYMKEFMES